MLSANISNVAIITIKNVDYRCIIHSISRSEAINLFENSVLENCVCVYIYILPQISVCSRQYGHLRNCRYLVKATLAVYLTFYKLIFFETLITFLESTIKLITGIFDFQT